MKLTYDNEPLHDLAAKVIIVSQSTQGVPEEAPQSWRHTLRVRLHFQEVGYNENLAQVRELRRILQKQQGVLNWTNDEGTVLLNQRVTVGAQEWPEAREEADKFRLQKLDLTFSYTQDLTAEKHQGLAATFQRAGVGVPVVGLGKLEGLRVEHDVQRYNSMRSHRAQAAGRISARGRWLADPLKTLAEGRLDLYTQLELMRAQVRQGMDGRFKFHSMDQFVRVENFIAEVDQMQESVQWSLSASYTEFPNEAGYAQAEYVVTNKKNQETGEWTVNLSGSIGAESEATATAKLNAVRTSVAGSGHKLLESQVRSENLDGEDGQTFVKLTFDEELQKAAGDLISWSLRISDSEETRAGMIRRSYSGTVKASGNNYDQAYATAAAQARALGDNKYHFKVTGRIEAEDHGPRQVSGPVIVLLTFAYEYDIKGSRLYLEVTSRLVENRFGLDEEQVSGSIVAADFAAAQVAYNGLLEPYWNSLVRVEETGLAEQQIARAGTITAADPAPAKNVGGRIIHESKFDFSFTVHRPKLQSATAIRYEIEVVQDFVTREKQTTVKGSVWGMNEAVAAAFLDSILAGLGALGNRRMSRRTNSTEKAPAPSGVAVTAHTGLNFDESYVARLTGAAAVLRCTLRESLDCSGRRIVVAPTAADVDVFQRCGWQSGRRVIAGEVVATDETTALAWIKLQRVLPMSAGTATAGAREELPMKLSFEPEFIDLDTGVARSGDYGTAGTLTANFKLLKATFEFTEVLEQLTVPGVLD